MRSVLMLFHAELRRRRTSWLALAFLVALVGGTVLAGASAAGRTASAFPNFVARYGYDAEVFTSTSFPKDFVHLPHVRSVAESTYYFNGNVIAGGQFVPYGNVNLLSLPTSHLDTTIKLLSGRMPVGRHEVLAGFSMEQRYGLRLGSIVTVPLFTLAQRKSVLSSNTSPPALGPRVNFRVVGFEVSLIDFPTTSPTYSLYTSTAFDRGQGLRAAAANFAQVRLDQGQRDMPRFQTFVNHLTSGAGFFYVQNEGDSTGAIEGSIHPQVVGWWLFVLFAALAGVALVAQALSRQSLIEKESYPTLAALGLRPTQLFGLGMIRAVAIGAAGALGAVALAFALSPFTPVGEARAAAPTHSFVFDSATFVLGALSIVLVVPILATFSSWRSSQVYAQRTQREQFVARGSSSVATSLGVAGVSPSVLIGARNALERGKGRSSVPVATALVGTILAVAALIATTVFGASLSNLLATPRLYGSNWQVDLANLPNAKLHTALTTLEHDPTVTRVTYGVAGKFVTVHGVPVQGIFANAAKGPMVFSLISGRYPDGNGQVDLGVTTLAQARAHVGSRVPVSVVNLSGVSMTRTFSVVGTVAIPPSFGFGGLGDGAVMTIHALEVLACPNGNAAPPCISKVAHKVASNSSWGILIGVVPGNAGRATVARLDRTYSAYLNVENLPTNLVNFGQAVNFPLLLGATLALFGAATLAHLLFVSVARRRRQFALLKVLGFLRRQVAAALCWQAATVALIGVVFGVPIGFAVGQVVWRHFAANLGAVPVAVVPAGTAAILVAVIVAGAVLLALIPATLASRVQPAEALREA